MKLKNVRDRGCMLDVYFCLWVLSVISDTLDDKFHYDIFE